MFSLSCKRQQCLHSYGSKLFHILRKRISGKMSCQNADAGLEALWTWSWKVKSASFAVAPAGGPCLGRSWSCHCYPRFSNSSQTENQSPLPVMSSVFIDDSPGVAAAGAKQRKPVDCVEAWPWNRWSSQDASQQEDKWIESIISITDCPW